MVDPKNGLAPGDRDRMSARISKSFDLEPFERLWGFGLKKNMALQLALAHRR
jgi:hypothetical protein